MDKSKDLEKELLNSLQPYLKVGPTGLEPAQAKLVVSAYKRVGSHLYKLIESHYEAARLEDKRRLWPILSDITREETQVLYKKLQALGKKIRKQAEKDQLLQALLKAFTSQAYRLVEKARHGDKAEVFYMVARIFVANQVPFPSLLTQVFSPNLPEDSFKILFYGFLTGLDVKKDTQEQTA